MLIGTFHVWDLVLKCMTIQAAKMFPAQARFAFQMRSAARSSGIKVVFHWHEDFAVDCPVAATHAMVHASCRMIRRTVTMHSAARPCVRRIRIAALLDGTASALRLRWLGVQRDAEMLNPDPVSSDMEQRDAPTRTAVSISAVTIHFAARLHGIPRVVMRHRPTRSIVVQRLSAATKMPVIVAKCTTTAPSAATLHAVKRSPRLTRKISAETFSGMPTALNWRWDLRNAHAKRSVAMSALVTAAPHTHRPRAMMPYVARSSV